MIENISYSLAEIDKGEPITPFLYKLVPVSPEDIVDVAVASGAESFLSIEDQRKFVNPDFLLKSSFVAIKSDLPTITPPHDHIFSYPEEGRSVPVAFGRVKYANSFVGSFVSIKGSGLAGYVPYLSQLRLEHDYVNAILKNQTPYGLFGRESATEDIKYSMALLEKGIKTALPLGFIVLKRDTIARYTRLYSDNIAMQELSRQAFQYIDTHDDEPVLYFRIGGTRRRVCFAGNYKNSEQSLSFHKYTERLALWQGIQLLAEELNSSASNLSDSCCAVELNKADLRYLQTSTKPDEQTQKTTLKIVLAYQHYLSQVLESLSQNEDSLIQKFMSYVYLPNYGDNTILKDFDTSLCWYDFEGIDNRSLLNNQKPVTIFVSHIINEYVGSLKKQQLIPPEAYTHSAI